MNKINVLHVIQNSNIGGVQQQLLSILRAYDRKIINPAVCSFKPIGEIGEQIRAMGIDVISLGIERHHRFSPRIIIGLYRLMKQRHIHVVRTHRYRANFYGRIAAFFAQVPVAIPSLHDNYEKDKRCERRLVNRLLALWTDCFVAVSDSIKIDIVRYDNIDPNRIIVIRNGVDTQKFSPSADGSAVRKELGISEKELVMGFVGRLVPAKGLPYLINAFSAVRRRVKSVRLIVVGGGQMLEELKEMAAAENIQDDIFFVGERTDVPQVLAAMDIFVMSSVAEGLANSLLEAMSAARPVLVTTAGGTGEIIEDGRNGLIVQSGSADLLESGMLRLLDDMSSARIMGEAARNYIEKNHSIRATAQAWEDLYARILKRKGLNITA